MSDTLVQVDRSDPRITVVTLNRPEKRNALSVALMEQLHSAIADAAADLRTRVLILRGEGPSFCAGLDLSEAADAQLAHKSAQTLRNLYESLCRSPLVTIAAAQGAVMGGGVGLLAACDLVVAAEDLKISFPEIHRGLVAALVTALLERQVNGRVLRELIVLGRTISASEAQAVGLINRIVPTTKLANEADSLARTAIAAAPGAVIRTKQLLDALAPRPIADALDIALQIHLLARNNSEAQEGIAAFREKRQPRWGERPQ